MGHAVHYRTSAGETRVDEVDSLDAAISMVERLRNDEGVSDVRVYKEIPIEFKAYYKVSVVDDEGGSRPTAEPATPSPSAATRSPSSQPSAQPSARASQEPPPGAMPLGQPTPPAPPSSQPSAAADDDEDGGEPNRRGSLFSRG